MYLESESVQDMVVLHSKWLCNDIIGNLVSQEKMARTRITGCFSLDDFQLMYPETDALELLQVFESLEICTQCENDGDIEYEFPCLNFVETLNGLWQRDLKRYPDAVYGGVRIKTSNDCVGQLKHLFQRIQVQLRRTVLQDTDENDTDLYQWHHGTKYCCGNLEGLLNMDRQEQFLEIKVRGPEDSRTAVFYFLEDFINVVEQVVMSICPGMPIQRHILSCVHLKEHCKTIKSYSPHDILLGQLDREMTLPLEQDITEHFADLVCMGSDDIVHNITLGVDLHISHLTLHTRRLLSSLLDLPHPMGHDWCLLAVTLGMTSVLPSLDCGTNNSESNTDRTLEEWAKDPRSTIGLLISKLRELGRVDAAEVVLWTAPFFRMLIYEEPSTDESTTPAPIVASTHTLSNLSR